MELQPRIFTLIVDDERNVVRLEIRNEKSLLEHGKTIKDAKDLIGVVLGKTPNPLKTFTLDFTGADHAIDASPRLTPEQKAEYQRALSGIGLLDKISYQRQSEIDPPGKLVILVSEDSSLVGQRAIVAYFIDP